MLEINLALDALKAGNSAWPTATRDTERDPIPMRCWRLPGRRGRGRLTLFLGAAPGVGKTYAMLARARRLKAEGTDIVVGLVETHGRGETAALLDGLEVLPRRQVAYQGKAIEEFDLDAALARRPRIIIVDELAHSNAPESRHPKRYQDVEELLDAGIDVWSAMNIQHLESLSDVVAQITGVQVRERVPDTVLSRADEVLLVDLAPDELIERLKEGKVYLPDNARRAGRKLLPRRQPDGPARAGAAPHRRPGRRPDGRLSQAERHRRTVAVGRAAARLHRSGRAVRKGGSNRRAAGLGPQCTVACRFDRARRPRIDAARPRGRLDALF